MDKADIEALKASHPILKVLEDLGIAVQNNRFRCPSPQNHTHGDRTPSVTVWPERGSFKCWVCPDMHGDVIDLVKRVRNCSFREALEFLGAPLPSGSKGRPSERALAGKAGGPRSSVSFEAIPGVAADPASTLPLVEPSGQTALFSPPRGTPATGPKAAAIGSPAPSPAPEDSPHREEILAALLRFAEPVSGAAARYLQKRRIFKRTWDGQRLRVIDDYAGVSAALESAFGRPALERAGFFNPAGHLRYYRHRLLFPYYDAVGKPVYMQARGIEADVKPKELSMSGHIPLPYNIRLLNGEPGQIYLCEGVIDTLTLLEQGFPAVGVPGAANFKPAWVDLFRNKTVHVAFDPDAPGESGAAKAMELLRAGGVEARRLAPPEGLDLNDWFRKG